MLISLAVPILLSLGDAATGRRGERSSTDQKFRLQKLIYFKAKRVAKSENILKRSSMCAGALRL
jgi:hypothetical protein